MRLAGQRQLSSRPVRGGPRPPGRVRRAASGTRGLVRLAFRDPEHVSERLTLQAARVLGPQAADWANAVRRARPDSSPAEIAEEMRVQFTAAARIQGAIAGTPFLIALVPAYVGYLWQEARMALRMAALYGRDPCSIATAAEILVLRGLHPTVEEAAASLIAVRDAPLPAPPVERRPLRTWIRSVYQLLVFGAFLDPGSGDEPQRSRLRLVAGTVLATAIWAMTWVLPVTFMVVMAWGCETHMRTLGRRTLVFYDGEAASAQAAIAVAAGRSDRGARGRRLVRSALLGLSVLIPIGFVAYANRVRQDTGINWVGALGALVALALLIAIAVTLRLRDKRIAEA